MSKTDSLLKHAIDMSGNEFAMGYDDSGCFWRFYYGSRGAGSMMESWPSFNSQSPEVLDALQEFIDYLEKGSGNTADLSTDISKKGSSPSKDTL